VLSRAAGKGWIAVGDAAAAFDPITSQGLANALGSALVAAGALLSRNYTAPAVERGYSDLVLMTFSYSETLRREIYQSM
jgi:flavin-dependent dehydrogenase